MSFCVTAFPKARTPQAALRVETAPKRQTEIILGFTGGIQKGGIATANRNGASFWNAESDSLNDMEKEIADCLLRGDMPILPPESFVKPEDLEPKEESGSKESEEDLRRKRKLKRKQYFRRQQLRKEREKRLYIPQTPSVLFVLSAIWIHP